MVRKFYSLIVCLFVGFSVLSAQTHYKTLMHEGNRLFDKGDFSGSESKFLGAITASPKDFAAHYNLGNALYKDKKFPEAKAEYEKALTLAKDKEERLLAQYNMGNTLMNLDDSKAAAAAYKKALKLDPYNEAARRNYEIAMLKEKEKESNAQGGGQGGETKSKGTQKDQNGKPGQGESGTQGEGQGAQADSPGEMPKGARLSKDEQKALLNRVEGRESETARKILNKNTYSVPRSNEKDW